MSTIEVTQGFTVISSGCCGGQFAVADSIFERWKRTGERWYCPHCRECRVFNKGKSRDEVRREEAERRAHEAEAQANRARRENEETRRKYTRMRKRIQNGVCPCCNRTFQNFAAHMATKHPEVSNGQRLKHTRMLLGMTQTDVAREIGCSAAIISSFERDVGISTRFSERIESWLDNLR